MNVEEILKLSNGLEFSHNPYFVRMQIHREIEQEHSTAYKEWN
jgi:hypothetical protein